MAFENEKIEIVDFVRKFMDKSARYREPHLELAKKSREVYENWQSAGKSLIQRANLKLPFGFTVIESQVPQLVDMFCRDDQVLTYQGKTEEDSLYEDLISDYHNSQLVDMGFFVKFVAYVKAMLLDGTAFAKIPYVYKEGSVTKRLKLENPITGEVKVEKITAKDVLYDGCQFEPIPIYDIFPDWQTKTAGDIQNMRGIVHRTYKTLEALKSAGIYQNLDEVQFSVDKKGNRAWSAPYYSYREDQFQELNDNTDPAVKRDGLIEVWEYWGYYPPKNEEYVIVIANGDVVIRFTPNFYDTKFKPFVATPNFIRDSEFYGIPELIAIRSLVKEANALRNARLDNVNLSVNPMFLVDKNAGIDLKTLYSRPGGLVLTNDIHGIRPLQLPDPSMSSLTESTYIQQDIQNTTALIQSTPTISQLGRTYGRSATGVGFLQSFVSNRLVIKARLLSWTCLEPMGRIMLATNRQFVTDDVWIRRSDPNLENPFVKLSPDVFLYNYKIVPKTDLDTGGVEGEFAKMQTVAQVVQVFENSQPGTVKADILLEALLRPILGRRLKKFVRSPEERAAIQAQNLATQQAINAMQGRAAAQPNAGMPPQDMMGE